MLYPVPEPPTPGVPPLVSPRGATLATRTWSPPAASPIRAICLVVHGAGWHSGYFAGLAQRLNQENIYVTAYDQVGMGYSDPEPDAPPGGYVHVRDFSYFVEDIYAAAIWSRQHILRTYKLDIQAVQKIPFFLLGESFGGLEVLAAGLDKQLQQQHSIQFAGIVTLGALLQVGPGMLPPQPVIELLKLMNRYCCPRLPMPSTDTSSTFDDAFGDKEWAQTARNDPKVQVSLKSTLAGAIAIITNCDVVANQAKDFNVPLLAIHAVHDCRTVCQAMMKFVDQVGPQKAEGMWIDNTTGHQLLQDTKDVTESVMNKVADWIVAKSKTK